MASKLVLLGKSVLVKLTALAVAAVIWLPCVHLLYQADPETDAAGIHLEARVIAGRFTRIWTDPVLRERELNELRRDNPEYDFMSRTFLVLALANMAMADPSFKNQALEVMDLVIDDTLTREQEHGQLYFLMDYATAGPWVTKPGRSQFVDGEIALMLAARRLVEEKPAYKEPVSERVELMLERMEQSPVLLAESYPDECWVFCNTLGLAAIRIADVLDGTDHSAFLAQWVERAQRRLVDPATGLLIAGFSVDGDPTPAGPGPEGSTIWMVCHMLQIIDEKFAADQYRRARKELGRTILGFGYSREWPESFPGIPDIDSGPVVPLLQASPGASGIAILGASAFDDDEYLSALLTSLNFISPPGDTRSRVAWRTGNMVGEAMVLCGLTAGPLWNEVRRRSEQ